MPSPSRRPAQCESLRDAGPKGGRCSCFGPTDVVPVEGQRLGRRSSSCGARASASTGRRPTEKLTRRAALLPESCRVARALISRALTTGGRCSASPSHRGPHARGVAAGCVVGEPLSAPVIGTKGKKAIAATCAPPGLPPTLRTRSRRRSRDEAVAYIKALARRPARLGPSIGFRIAPPPFTRRHARSPRSNIVQHEGPSIRDPVLPEIPVARLEEPRLTFARHIEPEMRAIDTLAVSSSSDVGDPRARTSAERIVALVHELTGTHES